MAPPARPAYGNQLSPSELRVLEALANGHSTTVTGAEFYISPHTVRSHLQRIYRKLGVHTGAHAVAVGLTTGLIAPTAVRPPSPPTT